MINPPLSHRSIIGIRWLGVQYCGSGPINHRFFSIHRKFSLNKMTGWRFEPSAFGTESLQIEP
jgi:hypothetical protein